MSAMISEKYKCIDFEIPARIDGHYGQHIVRLRVIGQSLNANYTFADEAQVYMQMKQRITFIQTDKPIYKPGQQGTGYHWEDDAVCFFDVTTFPRCLLL